MISIHNLLSELPDASAREQFSVLLQSNDWRMERIVSLGQQTPSGEWYDQSENEWVLLLTGAARLRIEGESQSRLLQSGDALLLPAHVRHRVEWTDPEQPTVWLAFHFQASAKVPAE